MQPSILLWGPWQPSSWPLPMDGLWRWACPSLPSMLTSKHTTKGASHSLKDRVVTSCRFVTFCWPLNRNQKERLIQMVPRYEGCSVRWCRSIAVRQSRSKEQCVSGRRRRYPTRMLLLRRHLRNHSDRIICGWLAGSGPSLPLQSFTDHFSTNKLLHIFLTSQTFLMRWLSSSSVLNDDSLGRSLTR